MADLEVGTIIRNCTRGKASYILVEAPPEPIGNIGLAMRCRLCVSSPPITTYRPRICNITECGSKYRKDKKDVYWKLHSIGRLSRSKTIF